MFFLVTKVFCQRIETGSLNCLRGEKELNFCIDFSKGKIVGMSEQDFIWKMSMKDSRGDAWPEYWRNECYREFLSKFCLNAFDETQDVGLKIGVFPDANYTAILLVETVDDDGEISGKMRIEETKTGIEKAVLMKVHGEGGRWGTIENLIGDAMERTGKSVGKYIAREISKVIQPVVSQSENNGKKVVVRFPETLSAAYNAFRDGSIYSMSKKEKVSIEQSFISEIENDLNNAKTIEDVEIINTKIGYLDQYSAIRTDLKANVETLRKALNELVRVIVGEE